MSIKKKQGKQAGGASDREQQLNWAKRQLEKGFSKDALKAFRQLDRELSSDETRAWLQRSYLARVQQLYAQGNLPEAVNLMNEWLALPPTLAEIKPQLEKLQVLLGVGGKAGVQRLEAEPELLAEMVDKAVLDPRYALPALGTMVNDVSRVREALQAVEKGQDETAVELLNTIPRTSPAADWKLFVRGLIAFYQNDSERVSANWQRLSPARAPGHLAQTLMVASKSPYATSPVSEAVSQSVRKLERTSGRDVLFGALIRLVELVENRDAEAFANQYRRVVQLFQNHPKAKFDALIDLFIRDAIKNDDTFSLVMLKENGPPLSWDPSWNWVKALYQESNRPCCVEHDSDRWLDYLVDVDALLRQGVITESERNMTVALLHQHIGDMYKGAVDRVLAGLKASWDAVEGVDPSREQRDLQIALNDERCAEWIHSALVHFKLAREAWPDLKPAYASSVFLHNLRGERQQACAELEALVKRDPNDYDAHYQLGTCYLQMERFEALEHELTVLSRLKPRATSTLELVWLKCQQLIRALVIARQFEAARQELAAARTRNLPDIPPVLVLAIQTAIEYKAGATLAAERSIEQVTSNNLQPATFWLCLARFAAEYKLPSSQRAEFTRKFETLLKASAQPAVAADLARLFSAFLKEKQAYVGRVSHLQAVTKYIQRCLTASWTTSELTATIRFLLQANTARKVCEAVLKVAQVQCPRDPLVCLLYARFLFRGDVSDYMLKGIKVLLEVAIKGAHTLGAEGDLVRAQATAMLTEVEHRLLKLQLRKSDRGKDKRDNDADFDDFLDDDDDYGHHKGHSQSRNQDRAKYRHQNDQQDDDFLRSEQRRIFEEVVLAFANQELSKKSGGRREAGGAAMEVKFMKDVTPEMMTRVIQEIMSPEFEAQIIKTSRMTGIPYEELLTQFAETLRGNPGR